MNNTALTKNREQVRTQETSQTGLDTISRGTIAAMGGVSALVGIWAAACFVGALFSVGGPLELAKSWFQAITGM